MIICEICEKEFRKDRNSKYCTECRRSGKARKRTLKKYNTSPKGRALQKISYYKDIERTKQIKNRYNRSIKGKESKLRYYLKNKPAIIKKVAETTREKIISRNNAHDKAKRQKIPRVCVICNIGDKINVHHIDRNPFNNDLDNLVYLCSSCHGKEHEALNLGRSNLPFVGNSPISIKKIIDGLRLISPN